MFQKIKRSLQSKWWILCWKAKSSEDWPDTPRKQLQFTGLIAAGGCALAGYLGKERLSQQNVTNLSVAAALFAVTATILKITTPGPKSMKPVSVKVAENIVDTIDSLTECRHTYPKITKAIQLSTLALSSGWIIAKCLGRGDLSQRDMATRCVMKILPSLALTAACALDFIIPPPHDMTTHVYKTGEYSGGELFYEGNVPILSLDNDKPFKAGQAQGYLCGHAIDQLTRRFDLMLHTIQRQPRAKDLPKTIAKMRVEIPSSYLLELQGVVDGYCRWAEEQPWWKFPKTLTVDDLLLIHLLPDNAHFSPQMFENKGSKSPLLGTLGCTTILEQRSPQDPLVFVRNLDWPSLGLVGTYSLVILRKSLQNDLQNTIEVGIPCLIGSLTGMNSQGLCLAMNVAGKDERCSNNIFRGLPAVFYNRQCLESCETSNEVEAFVANQSPLGPYHLTIADPTQGAVIHFYQNIEVGGQNQCSRPLSALEKFRFIGSHLVSDLKTGAEALCSLNSRRAAECCNDRRWGSLREFLEHRNSWYRALADEESPEKTLKVESYLNYLKAKKPKFSLENALAEPLVNNSLTVHRVMMVPATQELSVAFNNGLAGSTTLQPISSRKLLLKDG